MAQIQLTCQIARITGEPLCTINKLGISNHRQGRWYEEGLLKGPLFEV